MSRKQTFAIDAKMTPTKYKHLHTKGSFLMKVISRHHKTIFQGICFGNGTILGVVLSSSDADSACAASGWESSTERPMVITLHGLERPCGYMGMGQKKPTRRPQVLVFGSIYQGSILGTNF